jgi:hypothetical protein
MTKPAGRPPDTVFLHIGLHKTGTTYLQNVMRANRDGMRAQGVEFTCGAGEPVQAFAVWDLQGRRPRGSDDKRIPGSWPALVETINSSSRPTALISEERLSLSTIKQVRKAVRSFPSSEVRVVVTVRDLGRVAVSAWQEEVKNDRTWTWREFADAIRDPGRVSRNPARGFWLRQDIVKICETWEAGVPAGSIHIVTVPQPPAPPEDLLVRFASVVGFDPSVFSESPAWTNETVGVAATEVIRRLNERLDGQLSQRQHDQVIKLTVAPMLARRTEPVRFTLPKDELGWVSQRAEEIVGLLASRGYPVVGDLAELLPQPREGRRPDDATDSELLEASLDALAMLSERFATAWWQRRRPDDPGEQRGDLASLARGAVFRGQRAAADLADRNSAAAKAMSAVLRARDRARSRARGKGRGPQGYDA